MTCSERSASGNGGRAFHEGPETPSRRPETPHGRVPIPQKSLVRFA